MAPARTAHDFVFPGLDGTELALRHYAGSAVLIANTASACGFTPQYGGLQTLAERYAARGLIVLGVPSNDFGAQEPLSETEIGAFCTSRFGVTFPLTAKLAVKGRDAHPFFRWVRARKGPLAGPYWNFYKYVIAPDGRLVGWYSSLTKPDSLRLLRRLETVLPR